MIQKNTIIVHTVDMTRSWNADKIVKYIFAGHAVFAVNDVIYKVTLSKKDVWSPVYTLDEDTPTWIQMGWISPRLLCITFVNHNQVTSSKQKLLKEFMWWLKNHGLLPNHYKFQISRFCARCGTPLKSKVSLTRGYGPECMKEVNK